MRWRQKKEEEKKEDNGYSSKEKKYYLKNMNVLEIVKTYLDLQGKVIKREKRPFCGSEYMYDYSGTLVILDSLLPNMLELRVISKNEDNLKKVFNELDARLETANSEKV